MIEEKMSLIAMLKSGDYDQAIDFINSEADVNELDNFNQSPLLIACFKSLTEIGIMLINKGADVNREDIFGVNPLNLAIKNNNPDLIKALIDNGANLI